MEWLIYILVFLIGSALGFFFTRNMIIGLVAGVIFILFYMGILFVGVNI